MGVDFDGPEFNRLPDAGSELLDHEVSPMLALMEKLARPGQERVVWLEDDCFPRCSGLTKPLWWWSRSARVEHPEWFRVGDVLRPLNEDGEGRETAVVKAIVGDRLRLRRRVGAGRRMLRCVEVYIIGSAEPVTVTTRL